MVGTFQSNQNHALPHYQVVVHGAQGIRPVQLPAKCAFPCSPLQIYIVEPCSKQAAPDSCETWGIVSSWYCCGATFAKRHEYYHFGLVACMQTGMSIRQGHTASTDALASTQGKDKPKTTTTTMAAHHMQ